MELVEIDLNHRRAEMQIIIDPNFQGRGLASRAMRLALDYGFKDLICTRSISMSDKVNTKAVHLPQAGL